MINKQIIYIDESNILSNSGNSVYVCLHIKYLNKDVIGNKILKIEKDLKISYIHWVDMPWKLRIKFAEKIRNLDYYCKIVVYKNPIIQNTALENFLIKTLKDENVVFKIVIDGKKTKRYVNKLKTVLKDSGLKFNKIKFIDDKTEPLIRLADFMAGMYRSYIDTKNDKNRYIYNILRDKIKIPN